MGGPLLRAWPALQASLTAEPLLVLLDFDGTLAEIAPRPQDARLLPAARRALHALARMPGVQVGIISGRALVDVRRLVGIPGVVYAGNHGLEVGGAGLRFMHPAARRRRPLLRALSRQLEEALKEIPGALVEWKGLTISVHWRLVAPAHMRMLRRLVHAVLEPQERAGRVRITRGQRVLEVRPMGRWDKGAVVEWLVRRLARRTGAEARLLYAGDDQTDEDAFASVNRLGGASVLVGPPRPTAAGYRLRHPGDVAAWLVLLRRARRDALRQRGGHR
jgi:trehalose-phosphatase